METREKILLSQFELAMILIPDYTYGLEEGDEEYEDYFNEDGTEKNGIWGDFEIEDTITTYYCLEKSYEENDVIVKRKSDGKFFKGSVVECPYQSTEIDCCELEEVFPKQVMKTVYE